MAMNRGAFDDVPLPTLFPFLSPADVESLRHAARAVDAARVDGDGAEWEWALQHAVFPGTQPWTPIIFGLDVVEHAAGADQLEFQLEVVWTDRGRLAVDAAVNVACWCDTDHATHDVDALRLVVGEENSLAGVFQTGAERVIGWLTESRDADYWRARAGLPARQSC
ncbi:hypothetical protein E2C00_00300 [Streptomyces sp. WAC05374]|uniref:hypothetical protein n=1 Tax=Streptomyces sp. WAC05374 TaxID=2487420 RepID=UPI000F889A2C|nr:hypothetical protein [Streptomyces sp. WAC05374]RST19632.1 hypothetical protein EF905_00645 [Streptomyces sp. WAC05374]TDF50031.1 hypothetical protein E2B92_00275 [Streptomyces sp. WAC05374]TDF57757.1 hypothetical protein E2C02_08065 [Streptomyces sp. WAC05374]TDF60285.1 hypothetical protein E2C00_00300 [Streptomyces sp. WAC05374]